MPEKATHDKQLKERVGAFEVPTFLLGVVLSILSAIICMQIIGKVGVTPNTSLIGAIVAMVIARIPLKSFLKFRSLERQNLLQTAVSGAGFSAANCGFLTVAIFFVLGETGFILPMAAGSLIGLIISINVVGNIFDSSIFPAEAAWPPGVATAQAIKAGDEGGEKGKRLLQGLIIGGIASYFKLPAAGIGIVFIANIFSMTALGIGLLIRGYSTTIFNGLNLGSTYIPHGIMIGAGMMALIQSIKIILRGNKDEKSEKISYTQSDEKTKKNLLQGVLLFLGGAFVLALVSGVTSQLGVGKLVLWLLWATFSATSAMLLVGMAAMHSGWFPAFAITTIFMTIGIFFGFPIIPLALLTGYVSSVGPCFADMGYDLKAGWILRGEGEDKEYELYGRKQQVILEAVGGFIGIVVVLLTMNMYFATDLLPPISRVFASTVAASADPSLLRTLLIWAVPGVLLQIAGGPSRMVGVLFATGLLINNPIYGVGVVLAVIVRLIFGTKFMEIRDAGLIAGDGLYGFFSAVIKALI
ncbi:OPT/YSL family transporter [Geosporobacter ferrireducens]|uniref:Peptide transporter n=1 Tax=Geosporobacter ferrireducens TaxID=1424294 RepID=A0A1D8GM24_9FIRM|nr:OPT/YSL family transporter [Geosporobacter ferrireducens]AOT71963.1 peptide transporter [Geosporobacter ferrireducens]MTI55830.1 peptide transporter [Geosporobacter ferrireducens]